VAALFPKKSGRDRIERVAFSFGLSIEEKREEEVSFAPQGAGDNQKVEFLLYKNGEGEPYERLHLFIAVKE